jgi:hypothetical protein
MKSGAPERWSMWGSTKVGIILGAGAALYGWLAKSGAVSWPRATGTVVGSIIGAVFLVCVVAALRNKLVCGMRKS